MTPPTLGQVRTVLAGVRSGTPLPTVARRAKLSQQRVLDVVVGVGSRMSQANKRGPKADGYLPVADLAGLDVPAGSVVNAWNATTTTLELHVVLGDGWDRSAAHGRDIGRAYAAVVLADPAADDRPVSRWLGTLAAELEVTYGHFAHLSAVANGRMRTFTGLTDDADVKDAYLRAFDAVADAVANASAAVGLLCRPDVSAQQVLPALHACYWMVPDARIVAGLAKAATAGDPVAGSKLRLALGNLRAAVGRKPAAFFPRAISDLSARQYRAILAERGFHPSDMADAARTETDFSDLSSTLAAIRDKVNAGAGLESAAEEVTRLSASWRGLDA